MTKEKKDPSGSTHPQQEDILDLVLYNDEVNTFDFVIETLVYANIIPNRLNNVP